MEFVGAEKELSKWRRGAQQQGERHGAVTPAVADGPLEEGRLEQDEHGEVVPAERLAGAERPKVVMVLQRPEQQA